MNGYSTANIWVIIALLAMGTYAIRFSFLGLLGRRSLPLWALRLLRYTPVAVIPGMVAPMVLWPAATAGEPDPVRIAAAAATVAAGLMLRNVAHAILAGGLVLYLGALTGW